MIDLIIADEIQGFLGPFSFRDTLCSMFGAWLSHTFTNISYKTLLSYIYIFVSAHMCPINFSKIFMK